MTITWDDVGYYSYGTNKLNSFQLVLINEGNGNFDIEYRFGDIEWTTGSASGGSNGLGGTPARVGYSAATACIISSCRSPATSPRCLILPRPTATPPTPSTPTTPS